MSNAELSNNSFPHMRRSGRLKSSSLHFLCEASLVSNKNKAREEKKIENVEKKDAKKVTFESNNIRHLKSFLFLDQFLGYEWSIIFRIFGSIID